MGKDSAIEWTHHTFNPWWGCEKVSPACRHCYAESWANRVGQKVWGKGAERRTFSDKHWREPIVWNVQAEEEGVRKRVFCASMADVFENRRDLDEHRERLWKLIGATPNLDWLLLTKRPQVVNRQVPWKEGEWPGNVWVGTTVENQVWARNRLPALLKIPAARRFLSCEPMLGEIDLAEWLNLSDLHPIDWVIAGGESGHGARPMNPEWPRLLRDQCHESGIPFHFKQWGHWAPDPGTESKGKLVVVDGHFMKALGKKDAGRMLDGEKWDGVPNAA